VDRTSPLTRQKYMLGKVLEIADTEMKFNTFEEVATWFKRLINSLRQMNYSEYESEDFYNHLKEVNQMIIEIA